MKREYSVHKNATIGFIIIVLLVIASGSLGYIYTLYVKHAVGTVRQKSNQLETLTSLNENWLRIISTLDNILLTRQGAQVDSRLQILLDDFRKKIDLIESSSMSYSFEKSNQNLLIISDLKNLSIKLDSICIEISKLIKNGQWSRAQFIRHNDLASLQRRLEINLKLLNQNINQDLDKSVNHSIILMNQVRLFWTFTAILAILFGFFAVYMISKSILRPITNMVEKSKAIIAGDLSVRLKTGRNNEFDVLAQALNTMTEDFQNLIQNLKKEIEDRKKVETALIESEKKLKDIYENAIEGIFQTTLDGRFLTMNPAMIHYLGYDSEEDLLENCKDIENQLYVFPEERRYYITDILNDGIVMDRIVQLYKKDRKKIWMSLNTRLVMDENDKPLYLEGFAKDVTERKNLLDQLHQSQKMEAIGQLAGGIAHDFNNILTVILCYCDIMLRSNLPTDINKAAREMQAAGEKGKKMTSQLLAFSRKQVIKPKTINLNDIIENEYNMLSRMLSEDIEIEFILSDDLVDVKIDPVQIDQIIMNLLVNARDAMPDGGRLIIETENVEYLEDDVQFNKWIAPGKYVMLSITDTGIGMDEKVKTHLYEPFFTTKSKEKGTGLGLAIVYGIVKQNKGHIFVYSEINMGTKFKIYLPQTEENTDDMYKESEKKTFKKLNINQTILLVEDDPAVRLVTEKALIDYGYRILSSENGEQAIDLFKTHKDEINIIITDIIMPHMSGTKLAEILLKEKKSLQVIYLSGYTEENIIKTKGLVKNINFLQKPFTPSDLVKMIRKE